MIKYIKIYLAVLLICSIAVAQKMGPKFSQITIEHGLSANTVFCILQDSRGFLWVGTYDGLNRYDGYGFTVYKNIQEDPRSISDNKIRALCEDKNGNIWIGTWYGGLNKFNRETEKFTRYILNPDDSTRISSNGVIAICSDLKGNLWIGTSDDGLYYFDLNTEKFTHYKNNPDDPHSLSSNSIYSVYVDRYGILWVGTTNNGLNKFVEGKKQFIVFNNSPDNPQSISGKMVTSILEDFLGSIWIATRDGGLNKLDPETNKFIHYKNDPAQSSSLSSNDVWIIYEDSDSGIWVGTYSEGLNFFDRKSETFSVFRRNYNDLSSISDDAIFSIYEDRSGILWFGTWSGGLNRYDRIKDKFLTISHNPNNPNSLSSNGVYAIYKDNKGVLWVGTEAGGLTKIELKDNKFYHYKHNPNDPYSISSNSIYSICEDQDGYLWAATDYAGLNKFDRKTNRFQRYRNIPENPGSLGSDGTSLIFTDSHGDLWVGVSLHGIERLKKNERDFIHYRHNPNDPASVSNVLVYSFYEDRSKNLWIGTLGDGLMMYQRETDNFAHYRRDPDNPNSSLSNDIVSSICEDDDGILWIGTNGGGLNRFDRIKNMFKSYREKDGLSNDVIYGILSDDKGNLWISTGRGISRFHIKSEAFRKYDSDDGLQGDEFNQWAYFKGPEGEMYFGGLKGLSVFHPDQIKANPHKPQVVITDFQLLHKPVGIGFDQRWNRSILEKSITESKLIELKYDDNIISFELAALDFHNPRKNNYAYILEGFDKEWNHTDADRRFITYTNLDPGEYTLNIKGSNNDGVWNEDEKTLTIIIRPPWWSTWWAYIIYSLMFVFAFVTSTRIYLHRKRLRLQLKLEHEHAKNLEEVDQMKSNFYANLSHEFRTPLMLILGPAERIVSRVKDEELLKQAGLIKSNANRMLALINQLLELSRIEAGKVTLKASFGNLVSFVKGLTMEFESIAEKKDITLNLEFEKDKVLVYYDREKMEKIITNLLSNAFKFTPEGGTITVGMKQMNEKNITIFIKDSGVGIPSDELDKIFDRFYQVDGSHTREYEGTGIGLALTKELVEMHQGKIAIDSEEGKWTEVRLTFPLGKDHLLDEEIIESPETLEHRIEAVGEDYIVTNPEGDDSYPENLTDKTIVLVVEDNSDLREFMKEALNDYYHVEEAANGEQGFRKAEKFIPDLIISDIMMPRMDGREMTIKLKQDEKTSHIPVILLTAKSDHESKIDGLSLGADDYLIKPFDTTELLIRIKNLIETRKMLQEKFSAGEFLKPKKEKTKLSVIDEKFMNKIMSVIESHLSEENFSIEEFGKDVGMSRSQIHRKLKALTGKSSSVYLRSVRLAKARKMIEDKQATISEISYMVGFSSPAYFSRCFKEEFGMPPSEHSN